MMGFERASEPVADPEPLRQKIEQFFSQLEIAFWQRSEEVEGLAHCRWTDW